MWLDAVAIAVATLISEDLASIAAGVLARDGRLSLATAVGAAVAGVYLGDLVLWGVGRALGSRVAHLPVLRRHLAHQTLDAAVARLDRHLALTVLASRFLPGTRLPMYVAAGVWSRRPFAFALWSLVAVLIWTPLLVVTTAYLGGGVTASFVGGLERGVLASLLTAGVLWLALRLAQRAAAALRRYHQRFAHTTDAPI
jgi:membrane protein DedA with SNARE-associated domain